jgi:hypothetical protein
LPPTPARPPSMTSTTMSNLHHDSFTEHIYDEPTTLFGDCPPAPAVAAVTVTPTIMGTLTSYPRSTTSRIRLGTTALRPGSTRCHSPLSPGRGTGAILHATMRGMPLNGNGPHASEGVTVSISPFDGPPSTSASHPFYISNFAASPTSVLTTGDCCPSDIMDPGRQVSYSEQFSPFGSSPCYPIPSSSTYFPQSTELSRRGIPSVAGVYDQPWESIADRVPGSIPLMAIPNHVVSQIGDSHPQRHAVPRRVPETLSLLNSQPFMLRHDDQNSRYSPAWSDRHGRTIHSAASPRDRLTVNGIDGRYGGGGTLDRGTLRQQRWINNDTSYNSRGRSTDLFCDSSIVHGNGGRSNGGTARTHLHPRTDSAESCGNSSSSPLVSEAFTDSRHCHGNSDILNYLSPTCV